MASEIAQPSPRTPATAITCNSADTVAIYLEVGYRRRVDLITCSDVDMMSSSTDGRFVHKDGRAYLAARGLEELMFEATCDCGAVRLQIERPPEKVNDCPCSWCQRLGALWAYYSPAEVQVVSDAEATEIYQRATQRLEFHRCKTCGLTSHWISTVPSVTWMGVNSRLMPKDVRSAARVVQED